MVASRDRHARTFQDHLDAPCATRSRGIRDVAADSPTAADRLADRLFQAGQRLSDFPDVGRLEGVTRVLATVPPYLIRYRVQREGVVIVGVRHGRRRS